MYTAKTTLVTYSLRPPICGACVSAIAGSRFLKGDAVFYSQPLSTRFGNALIGHLNSETWTKLDIAVAWVRASGIAHLAPAISDFLKRGSELSLIVGIDFDNTTKEGLDSLLALEKFGSVSTYVHYNESGTVFHPKLYLFRNLERAKLIVGSNNLTEAGLFQNTEAGLEFDVDLPHPVVTSALNALESWRDTTLGLARKLDTAFLADLVANGYVKDEATVRRSFAANRGGQSLGSGKLKKLFGGVPVTPPAKPTPLESATANLPLAIPAAQANEPSHGANSGNMAAASLDLNTDKTVATTLNMPSAAAVSSAMAAGSESATAVASSTQLSTAVGQVLLMRLRKAHVTDRPTQTQIPKEVANSSFFGGMNAVISAHTSQVHEFRKASARGAINTLKLEIPEMKHFDDPVIRFERSTMGVHYEVYDRATAKGSSIMDALTAGRSTIPPSTNLTKPSTPDSSTWWRFI
jgi:HKD family nuclease